MGSVPNVGLMAQAAEEYGSHDKTFKAPGNGIIRVSSGRAAELEVGGIRRGDVGLQVADNDDLNVLGMNFLSSLSRWGVEGRWLVLVS